MPSSGHMKMRSNATAVRVPGNKPEINDLGFPPADKLLLAREKKKVKFQNKINTFSNYEWLSSLFVPKYFRNGTIPVQNINNSNTTAELGVYKCGGRNCPCQPVVLKERVLSCARYDVLVTGVCKLSWPSGINKAVWTELTEVSVDARVFVRCSCLCAHVMPITQRLSWRRPWLCSVDCDKVNNPQVSVREGAAWEGRWGASEVTFRPPDKIGFLAHPD